ncbi:3'-5' exonuclease KapD [Niallia circulans]
MEKQQYLFIDFEFTMPEKSSKFKGFYPEIIEVGIVAVIGDTIREQFSSYVVPRKFSTLSRRCKSFLHISQEQVNNGISLYDLMKKLEAICNGYQNIIVTWGNMDMKVLKDNCHKAQLPFILSCKEVDLSMEYKRFLVIKTKQAYGKQLGNMAERELGNIIVL